MRTIHEVTLRDPGFATKVVVPRDAWKALHVHEKGGFPTLWYETLADCTGVQTVVVKLVAVGTGWDVPEGGTYLGTAHVAGNGFTGSMVWHVYLID